MPSAKEIAGRITMFNTRRIKFFIVLTVYGNGAGDGIRTRDLQLGKLTLYH